MKQSENVKLNPRLTFWKCETCSRAMFYLLNYEFENRKPQEEKASDILAGGIAMKGQQCGMLWGGALAIGTESYQRFNDLNEATATAIHASKFLIDSFYNRVRTVNCLDISKTDWEKKSDRTIYILKTIVQGFVFSKCFNLMSKWTPDAITAVKEGLVRKKSQCRPCLSCSAEVLKKMGATHEESIMVAGFAGGIGLSGNACGALSAVIWYSMLVYSRKNHGKRPAMFNNLQAKRILSIFYQQTNAEILCRKISGKQFASVDEHTAYLQNGGCRGLLEALARSLEDKEK